MRRELQPKPAAGRRVIGPKARKQAQKRQPDEYPLAHDAATWDEDTFESGWDGDEAQLTDDIARLSDD